MTNHGWKIGDKALAFGVMGTIVEINNGSYKPLAWQSDCKDYISNFYSNGNACKWAKEPSLVFHSRPKKMVKRIYYIAVGLDLNDEQYRQTSCAYRTKEEAEKAIWHFCKESHKVVEFEMEEES